MRSKEVERLTEEIKKLREEIAELRKAKGQYPVYVPIPYYPYYPVYPTYPSWPVITYNDSTAALQLPAALTDGRTYV